MMNRKNTRILLLILIIASILLISACAKKECKTSADCGAKTCFTPKCGDGKCSYVIQKNCCGNRLKDSIENEKPGNQCTCPEDHGKCEGTAKIKIGSRTEDARYLKLFCTQDQECKLSVDPKDVQPQNFLDAISIGYFKASIVTSLNKPFDLNEDSITLKATLDDASKDVSFPIQFSKIKILYASETSRQEQLIAEKQIDASFSNIGDETTIAVPLNLNYRPQQPEESGSIRFTIDYTFLKKIAQGKNEDGTTKYSEEISRGSYSSPSKAFVLVKSG